MIFVDRQRQADEKRGNRQTLQQLEAILELLDRDTGDKAVLEQRQKVLAILLQAHGYQVSGDRVIEEGGTNQALPIARRLIANMIECLCGAQSVACGDESLVN